MATENLTATSRGELALSADEPVTTRPGINVFESTVEMTAAASATSTYWMARLPTSARISGQSFIALDDLASTGSPVLDIGLFSVGGNFTDDDTALNASIDAATASARTNVLGDPADIGKRVWELAGEASDPGGYADVKISLKSAGADDGGTISMSLVYGV